LQNPLRYTTPKVGSRNTQTTIYWLDDQQQVICGCFKGTLKEFEAKVKQVHNLSSHLLSYLHQIKIMKYLIRESQKVIN
jgi:penicillin-binding protein-related factor A (putative recombinase)